MPLPKFIIRTLTFSQDGSVGIDFMEPLADIRENDLLMNHVLFVPAEDEYDDEIDALRDAALYLLADALEDFRRMPPLTEAPPDNDDDEDEE